MPQRILVADADAVSREFVTSHLAEAGWAVTAVSDGASAFAEVQAQRPHLVVLDLALPEISGIEICRRVRYGADTATLPLVVVSAHASELDRVVAFEIGVDDFIEKGCSGRELVLRVRAVLRRSLPQRAHAAQRVTAGPLVVDLARHCVTVTGREIILTPIEFKLLAFFVANRERVHSRETLLARVWDLDPEVQTRTVDTYVKRLRTKLGEARPLLETLRGIGYRLRDTTTRR